MTGADKALEDADELDRKHFVKTLAAFRFFGYHLSKHVEHSRSYYNSLPPSYQNLISEFNDHLHKVEKCIECNNNLISTIIQFSAPEIFNGEHSSDLCDNNEFKMLTNFIKVPNQKPVPVDKFGPYAFTNTDMDKVRSTLKQFVRDWSIEGKPERDICYQPVIDEIVEIFKSNSCIRSNIRILVPGAGLGRLAWELAHRGFTCQGNEWSLYMLIPSYFILNTCKKVNEYKLYPWISQFCNNMSREDQLAFVQFPDTCPTNIPENSQFSMAAGDFVEIYTEPCSWDCVATVFFIDTAHNILQYLDTIWKILKPGGYWINFGPLLYHFCDVVGAESLELSFDELRLAIQRIGFETIKEKSGIECSYTQNPKSMLSYNYSCVFGVYQKPLHSSDLHNEDGEDNYEQEGKCFPCNNNSS